MEVNGIVLSPDPRLRQECKPIEEITPEIEALAERMKREIGEPNAKVIATGGLALLVAGDSNVIDVLDGLLTLKGLCLIYGKNAG